MKETLCGHCALGAPNASAGLRPADCIAVRGDGIEPQKQKALGLNAKLLVSVVLCHPS